MYCSAVQEDIAPALWDNCDIVLRHSDARYTIGQAAYVLCDMFAKNVEIMRKAYRGEG